MHKVLIVEDEAIIAADLRHRLERLQYEVVGTASTAADALAITAEGKPDIVLMDIRLRGDGDGVVAADEIRRRFSLPVVYLSAYADSDTLARARVTEPFGYLVKPVDDQKLHAALQIALHKHVAVRRTEESERWLFTTLACIGDAVASTDPDGAVRFINRVAETLTEWSCQEAVGQPVDAIVRIADGAAAAPPHPVVSALARRGVVALADEATLVSRSGRTIPIDDTAAPIIDARGHLLGAVMVFRDATERKALEAQLRQAQKMEAIGQLAGGVAHDFNNLLTVILGRAELLRSRAGTGGTDSRDLDLIHQTAERATVLTRQLLAFSRRGVVAPEAVDVNVLLLEMESMLRRLIREDIELTVRPAAEPLVVRVDPVQLQQAVLNLAVNARDAMPEGGRLTIETYAVAEPPTGSLLPDRVPGPYVALAVTDTGIGMDAEVRRHLFEPYFTTKERGQGTGLGLATVYGIVRRCRGHIDVLTAPNRGSTLTLYLPRQEISPVPAPPPSVQDPPDSPPRVRTILLVEDNDDVRELMRELLERNGYRMLDAASGPAALEACRHEDAPIDLLITDLVMPHMSGRELAERFRALRPAGKVLYVSGHADDIVALQGILQGESAFLHKPFTLRTLLEKVQSLLGAD